jgi:PAS domain S-box-containing protein
MSKKIRILYFEDVPANAERAFIHISMNGISFSPMVVDSEEEYTDALISFNPDLILADYGTLQPGGKEVLVLRNEIAPLIPFIFVARKTDGKDVAECVNNEADCYVLSGDLTNLLSVIETAFAKRGMTLPKFQTEDGLDPYYKNFVTTIKPGKNSGLSVHGEGGFSREDYDLIEEKLTVLDMAMESAGIGTWVYDRPGKKRYFDSKSCQLLGFAPGTFKKSEEEFFEIIHPDDRNKVRALIEQSIEKKSDLEAEFRIIHSSGQQRFLTARAKIIVDKNGAVIRLIGLLWDITEQNLLQMELEENIRRTNSIVNNLNGAVFRCKFDEDWTMEYISEGVLELTGYPSGEFTENEVISYNSIIAPEDRSRVRETISDAIHNMNPYTVEYRINSADNKTKWIWERGRGLFTDGKVIGLEGFLADISDKKKVEEELQSSLEQQHELTQYIEKVREADRVAISRELHDDLGQALTAVKIDLGTIRQITHEKEVDLRIKKVSDLVTDSIKTVQSLTSRLRPQIIDDLGLVSAIDWYTTEYSERSHIEISLDMDEDLDVEPDTAMVIFRIMQEALTNVARHSKANTVEIKLIREGNDLSFRMSDNGIGITDSQLASRKSFGIISMKERAASLGGTFKISGEIDGGTVIELIFPLNLTSNHENTDL